MTGDAQLPVWGDRRKSLDVRYFEWRHSEQGRELAHQVEQVALAQARAGAARISINLIFEQLRQAQRASIDNSFRALLARELRKRHPVLTDKIHIKDRKAAA